MKVKRMQAQDFSAGDTAFKIRPLGAMDAAYVFGDVTSIVLPILGTVAVSSGDEEAASLEMFNGMKLDTESLAASLGKINGQKLTALANELILKHQNVSFYDTDSQNWKVLTRGDFDEIFCMDLAGIIHLCVAIIQQNYSGFFSELSTLFGNLVKNHQEAQPETTVTSTANA